jgi:hypothetical protein
MPRRTRREHSSCLNTPCLFSSHLIFAPGLVISSREPSFSSREPAHHANLLITRTFSSHLITRIRHLDHHLVLSTHLSSREPIISTLITLIDPEP